MSLICFHIVWHHKYNLILWEHWKVLHYLISVVWLCVIQHGLNVNPVNCGKSRCPLPVCSTLKFMVFVHAKIGELKVKDLGQKLHGISGFIFYLQLCEGQQLKHQILLKAHTE